MFWKEIIDVSEELDGVVVITIGYAGTTGWVTTDENNPGLTRMAIKRTQINPPTSVMISPFSTCTTGGY